MVLQSGEIAKRSRIRGELLGQHRLFNRLVGLGVLPENRKASMPGRYAS